MNTCRRKGYHVFFCICLDFFNGYSVLFSFCLHSQLLNSQTDIPPTHTRMKCVFYFYLIKLCLYLSTFFLKKKNNNPFSLHRHINKSVKSKSEAFRNNTKDIKNNLHYSNFSTYKQYCRELQINIIYVEIFTNM